MFEFKTPAPTQTMFILGPARKLEVQAAITFLGSINTEVMEQVVAFKRSKSASAEKLLELCAEADALKVKTDNGLDAAKKSKLKFQNFLAAVE